MKRIRLLFVSMAVAALGLVLNAAPALAAAPSATGGGSTSFFTFGFTAQSHSDGTVSGNAEFQFPGTSVHVRLDCLVIVGNDAYMSGQTTEQTDGLSQGTEMLFGVQDNGGTSQPDLISDVFFSPAPPFTCQTFHAPPHYPVTGSVHVG